MKTITTFCFSLIFVVFAKAQENFIQEKVGTASKEEKNEGANAMIEYFELLNYPYTTLSTEQLLEMKAAVSAIPSEKSISALRVATTNEWQAVGPYGMHTHDSPYRIFSGRVTGLESSSGEMRVLSASGNLWHYFNLGIILVPVSISDNLNSQWGGAFVTSPLDSATIFLGTGEPRIHNGTGLWKTTDLGNTWNSIAMSPTPGSFYKIFYDPSNSTIMHAATNEGYFRSIDGGTSWTRHLTGETTDLVIDSIHPQTLYTIVWHDKFYKSMDGGLSWNPLAGGAPTTNVGRTALAICNSDPNVLYANVTDDVSNSTMHIYKTINGGGNWDTCHIGLNIFGQQTTEFHWGQGWYNNAMTVHPQNCDLAFAGGGSIWRTTDGYDFEEPTFNMHVDQHTFNWNADATVLYIGCDGGIFYTDDFGASWKYNIYNFLPITQFYHFDNGTTDHSVMVGGSQDNCINIIHPGQAYWSVEIGGDGYGVAVDPNTTNNVYAIMNQQRFASADGGVNWTGINSTVGDGLIIRTDHNNPAHIYTTTYQYIYESSNQGSSWSLLSPSAGLPGNVFDISFSRGALPTVYAPLYPGNSTRLWVRDGLTNTWYQRDAGLPTNSPVRKVVPDLLQANIAYALIEGFNSGNKVFKTTDRGQSWTNISGNLPDVPLTDLIPYPYNPDQLYLATEEGGFKTTDGGTTWVRWNSGMPESIQMTEMKALDSIAVNGSFWVRTSTFGRGIWQRDISGDDATAGMTPELNNTSAHLYTPHFNSNNNSLLCNYQLFHTGNVELVVYDLFGREVTVLVNETQSPGSYSINKSLNNIASGVYLCKLNQNGKTSITEKFIISR
ncbi:MAG: T9SS type A sorting domain-containing protein [Bacteroidia bacterium]|nr:T9SS type A sorting domain-containing protein [Bacteroidia bacterium]